MALLLTNTYGFSITKAIFVIGFMVLGQASQFLTGHISDKIKLSYYRIIGLVFYSIPFITIILYKDLLNNEYLAAIIFYLFGMGRSFFANYEYKLMMNLIAHHVKVNQMSFVNLLVSESTHYISYIALGSLLLFGLDIIVWLFFDIRKF